MRSIAGAFALASGFVLCVVLAGGGCYSSLCEVRGIPPVDNRDRKAYPTIDKDWVCTRAYAESYYESTKPPPPPPPPPPPDHPDVAGDHPATTGPKDPVGVVNSAIFVNSCFGNLFFFDPRINSTIQSTYFEQLRNQTSNELLQRTDCFKDKTNGCEAMRECLGLVQQINGSPALNLEFDPDRPSGCMGDTGTKYSHNSFYDSYDVYYDVYTWFNCAGLGLTCDEEYHREWCGTPRTACNPEVDTYTCWDTRPFYCEKPWPTGGQAYYWQEPRCGDFGLVCASEVVGGPPDCVGEGAACEVDPAWSYNLAYYSFREGVACESETMMRACVGRGEHLVDCAQLGKGFTCIPGTPTRCGLATECEASDPVRCEGDSLVVCDAGKIRKVDCKSLGFTSCDAKHNVCSPGVYDNLP
ncbi:MAG TPA: hypothetical protein PKA58_09995 [Polyangium sp.]|nr:hypothetical protein [Polyangium sp.]